MIITQKIGNNATRGTPTHIFDLPNLSFLVCVVMYFHLAASVAVLPPPPASSAPAPAPPPDAAAPVPVLRSTVSFWLRDARLVLRAAAVSAATEDPPPWAPPPSSLSRAAMDACRLWWPLTCRRLAVCMSPTDSMREHASGLIVDFARALLAAALGAPALMVPASALMLASALAARAAARAGGAQLVVCALRLELLARARAPRVRRWSLTSLPPPAPPLPTHMPESRRESLSVEAQLPACACVCSWAPPLRREGCREGCRGSAGEGDADGEGQGMIHPSGSLSAPATTTAAGVVPGD